jgi:DNA-directed RNA polymerase subunit RPC12/RpoP
MTASLRNCKIEFSELVRKIEQLQTPSSTHQSGLACPNCGHQLIVQGEEIYCEEENCKYDKILSEIGFNTLAYDLDEYTEAA